MKHLKTKELNALRYQIGTVFQHFNLLQSLTVYQNVKLALSIAKQDDHATKEKILSVLERVGLLDKKDDSKIIKVVATEKTHAEILREAAKILKEQGYTLKITVIDQYPLGNPAVANDSADANYFQHVPYFNAYNKTAAEDQKLVNAAGIHIEPIGLYSGKISKIADLQDGDKIIISDNVPDYGRIVNFLNELGLVTVAADFNPETEINHPDDAIVTRKVNFTFEVIKADLLVAARSRKEGALFFINGNYALLGKLGVSDAIEFEPTENNPYVNIVAVLKGRENEDKIKALVAVLQSQAIKDFITTTYQGSVIAA